MITVEEFELFCRRACDQLLERAHELGDEAVNRAPTGLDAPSVFALGTHVVGVGRWWIDHLLLGEPSDRNRDTEFSATGTVAELEALVSIWLADLATKRDLIAAATDLAIDPHPLVRPLGAAWTPGAVLLHVHEELTQHLGHADIISDLVTSR